VTERPYHHGNLRAELLQRAARTVRERGVEQLSLRELARQTGVSHGAPRRHFADREALLEALAESGFQQLGRELRVAEQSAGPGFEARVRAVAGAYARFATDDAALLEVMFTGKRGDPEGPLHDAGMLASDVVAELIAHGQAEGLLDPAADPERVMLVLFAVIQGAVSLLSAGIIEPDQLDAVVADGISYFLRGAQPPS
jgi:AcrR family transcriptional regulator